MIHAIVFSKNRASQLRLLLESIEKYARGIFDITVLYTISNEDHEKGYEKLMKEFQVEYIKETNLKEQLLEQLKKPYEHTAYFCDDDVFYDYITTDFLKAFSIQSLTPPNYRMVDVLAFSLHLGTNNTYCYPLDIPIKIGSYLEQDGFIAWYWNLGIDKWNDGILNEIRKNNPWRGSTHDFAYPLTVTSQVFRTRDIQEITEPLDFKTPNEYETAMQKVKSDKLIMASYPTSRVVNVPTNIVQETHANKFGVEHKNTANDLNDKYLKGEVIDINCIPSNITATHQEFPFTFKKI